MADPPVSLRVDLWLGVGADAEEIGEAARDLLRELRRLDVMPLDRIAEGELPPGLRAIEVAALGSLVLELGRGALGPVADVLQRWLAGRSGRTVKLTLGGDSIEIGGGSAAYQRQLIETFLAARTED